MSQPIRVQRKRVKGYRLPPHTSCVTRPGHFGNPFDTAAEFERVFVAIKNGETFDRESIDSDTFRRMKWIVDNVSVLRGFNLACFCSLDQACHADTLLKFANED